MKSKIMKMSQKAIKRLFGTARPIQPVEELYEENEYLEAYSRHTDLRVDEDPKSAIGGMWEEIGLLQFDFLISKAMQPHNKLLDLGCGTLRGGRHFIKYLNSGNYYGIDISSSAIASGKRLIKQEGLSDKVPHLMVSENKDLKFQEFFDEKFDYIIAQSVFTHLKPRHIEECFEHVGNIMHKNSFFYFTYKKGDEYTQTGLKDFVYPFSFFESLAQQNGFTLRDRSKDYNHHRGQMMAELRKLGKKS